MYMNMYMYLYFNQTTHCSHQSLGQSDVSPVLSSEVVFGKSHETEKKGAHDRTKTRIRRRPEA